MPNNSQGTAPQETLDMAKRFQGFVEGLIKDALRRWERFPRAKVTSLGEELPNNVFQHTATLVRPAGNRRNMCSTNSRIVNHNGTSLIDLCQNASTPFIHNHNLMDNWPKKSSLILSFVFMPNNVPLWRSGWRTFIAPFSKNQLLKDLLSSNLFPTKLGRVRQEGCNLRPPPLCRVNKKLIQFSKEQVELGLRTSLC